VAVCMHRMGPMTGFMWRLPRSVVVMEDTVMAGGLFPFA